MACVDAVTGNYVVFNETNPQPVKAILSSASIPFAFPSQVWDNGVVCLDGGSVWNVNLVSAAERCREMVDHDSQITIDILIADAYYMNNETHYDDGIGNFLRYRSIKNFHTNFNDVFSFRDAYPLMNFRHLIMPNTTLVGGINEIRFKNETITFPMQEKGRKDGEFHYHT